MKNYKLHGHKSTKLYQVWCSMKQRCFNVNGKNFHRYGGRGISICEEWRNDYVSFYNWSIETGYKDGLSIDRINNNGNYEPLNCRWVKNKEQSRNKENTIILEYNGTSKSLAEWADIKETSYQRIFGRYRNGWSIEKILETPFDDKLRNIRNDITKEELLTLCNKKYSITKMESYFKSTHGTIKKLLIKYDLYDYWLKSISLKGQVEE